jgi:hypothetical protein
MTADTIDSALELVTTRGPEFNGGLSNHGPMAADALIAMGREGDVERWAEWYAAKLVDAPEAHTPIDEADWREALGRIKRVADWQQYFQQRLEEEPWAAVLDRWVARLAPGLMAGATHGIIRTAHAVRSLDRGVTPLRMRELASGLAYWAARYQELPTSAGTGGALRPAEALERVPLVDPSVDRGFLIFTAVKTVETTDFAPVINLVDVTADVDAFVHDVTRLFAGYYLANAKRASIAFVHTVTAPSSLRMLAPHLSDSTTRDAMRYAWQACAAVYAAYATGLLNAGPRELQGAVDTADIVEQAVAARDEHAIKFTEACLREYALHPDAIYIDAARDVVRRLRAS